MSAEEDYSSLPLEERLVHKVWKVRLGAYEELLKVFSQSPSEDAECFKPYLSNPGIFKKIVGDSNVVAQEAGVNTLNQFLKYAGPTGGLKVRSIVIPPLVEKGLASTRANTKNNTNEALQLLIELDTPEPVVEELANYFKHRLPKLVAGTANAVFEIYKQFGAKTVDPKFVLPHLPKLFSHADKKVRAEAMNISVELYKWLGQGLETILFPNLKPVHQKDLTKEFEKVAGQPPQQQRLLRTQQEELARLQSSSNDDEPKAQNSEDVQMIDVGNQLDPYDLVEPVDVLSKLPPSLPKQIKSSKWKERKEILEEIAPFFKELKYKVDDYSEFLKILANCMKDVNLQVVQLAAEITEGLNKGLRANFNTYLPIMFIPVLERTKEKKVTVLEPLLNLLDTMVRYATLPTVLEDTINVLLKTKIPKVKEEVYKFLTRCLKNVTVMPTTAEVDTIMKSSLKGVVDMQLPVRNAAQETIGTLMKVVGERMLAQYMEKVDDIRQKKIKEFYDKAEVKAIQKPAVTKPPQNVPSQRKPAVKPAVKKTPSMKTNESLIKKKLNANSNVSIPSKREASSPLKRNENGGLKASKGLTAMVINKDGHRSSTTLMNKLENVVIGSNGNFSSSISNEDFQELKQLREEKKQWAASQQHEIEHLQKLYGEEKKKLMVEIDSLRQHIDKITEESTKNRMTIKSKDIQISRLIVDYEKSQQTIQELQDKLLNRSSMRNGSAGDAPTNNGFIGKNNEIKASRLTKPISHVSVNFHSSNSSNSGSGSLGFPSSNRNSTLGFSSATKSSSSAFSKRYSIPVNGYKQQPETNFKRDSLNQPNDINTGVGKLSIEEKENSNMLGKTTGLGSYRSRLSAGSGNGASKFYSLDSTHESDTKDNDGSDKVINAEKFEDWKRANEVTINLKARIEKMKHRSRNI